MRIACGTDLVLISRVQDLMTRQGDRFTTRYFTAAEVAECGSEASRMAARWAAKEAAMKALGQGLDVLDPATIEVVLASSGAPSLVLAGSAAVAARTAGWSSWSVSLSHEGAYATATVVAICA